MMPCSQNSKRGYPSVDDLTVGRKRCQLAARLQILVTSQRRDHLLTHLLARAAALDDLQIGASGRGLAAKVHGGASACWCAHRAAIRPKNSTKIPPKRGNTFSTSAPSAPAKSIVYVTRPPARCRVEEGRGSLG